MQSNVYRFWDNESNMMTEGMTIWDLIGNKQINYTSGLITEFSDIDNPEKILVPMLQSDATDYTGRKLYDQDIVEHFGNQYVLCFSACGFRLRDIRSEIPFFDNKSDFDYAQLHNEPICETPHYKYHKGNTFENPEIIEEQIQKYKDGVR